MLRKHVTVSMSVSRSIQQRALHEHVWDAGSAWSHSVPPGPSYLPFAARREKVRAEDGMFSMH